MNTPKSIIWDIVGIAVLAVLVLSAVFEFVINYNKVKNKNWN